jgi:hypothetical protein
MRYKVSKDSSEQHTYLFTRAEMCILNTHKGTYMRYIIILPCRGITANLLLGYRGLHDVVATV